MSTSPVRCSDQAPLVAARRASDLLSTDFIEVFCWFIAGVRLSFLHSSLLLVCCVRSTIQFTVSSWIFFSFRTHSIFKFGYIVCNGAQLCVTSSAMPRTCLPAHVYPESTRHDRPGVWAGHAAVTQPWPGTEHAGQRALAPAGNLGHRSSSARLSRRPPLPGHESPRGRKWRVRCH